MSSPWSATVPVKRGEGEGGERFVPEEGNHPSVLVGIIDLGTHKETFGNQDPKDTHKVLLVWELSGLKVPGTAIPVTIGRDYTFSLSEKAHLRSLIKSWRGKDLGDGEEFDITKLLGQPCLVNVAHKTAKGTGNSYGIVASVSGWSGPMVKSLPKPAASIKPSAWTFSDGPYPAWGWVPFMCALGEVKEVIKDAKENRRESNGRPTSRAAEEAAGDAREPEEAAAEEIPF